MQQHRLSAQKKNDSQSSRMTTPRCPAPDRPPPPPPSSSSIHDDSEPSSATGSSPLSLMVTVLLGVPD